MKGSAYEEKHDNSGKAINKSAKEVLQELKVAERSKNVPLYQQQLGLSQSTAMNTEGNQ